MKEQEIKKAFQLESFFIMPESSVCLPVGKRC